MSPITAADHRSIVPEAGSIDPGEVFPDLQDRTQYSSKLSPPPGSLSDDSPFDGQSPIEWSPIQYPRPFEANREGIAESGEADGGVGAAMYGDNSFLTDALFDVKEAAFMSSFFDKSDMAFDWPVNPSDPLFSL